MHILIAQMRRLRTLALSVLAVATIGQVAFAASIDITDQSFRCMRDMTPVRHFYVDNLAGDLQGTLAAANNPKGAIYPPGSVVQLSDERYALVVAVNSTRPLKPSVVVHEPRVPRHEALVMDLEKMPELSIRRSVKPSLLPAASLDYLAPRLRVNYFFEASDAVEPSEAAA